MLFTTDQQTLDDLNIFGKYGCDSVFAIFNKTVTRGGTALLKDMFHHPLSNDADINRRSGIVENFALAGTEFPFDATVFDAIDPYLSNTDSRTKLAAQEHSASKRITNLIAVDADTLTIHKGIIALATSLKVLHEFATSFDETTINQYQLEKENILVLLGDPAFSVVLSQPVKSKLSDADFAEFDELFRFRNRNEIRKLLRYIFELDVYIAVSKVAVERGFAFPRALPKGQHGVYLQGLYHPLVNNAVANSIHITPQNNVIFLTGANMAGKSTFMKSLSVAMFLAHMGFPVAADKMEFSVLDGMFTTINLPDNLGMGASHFYAEVLRAKKVAGELRSKNLFIVFDELFRGTNVKDACEATITFTEAFCGKRESIFVISSHIIEAGNTLKERCNNINFTYLPTLMEGTRPVYTYKLAPGITEDRHGMIIINNEGILDILEEAAPSPTSGFKADKQTLADLNLLGKYRPDSIYSLFNKVQTAGGERLLQEMFHHPLTDADQINMRSNLFKYFGGLDLVFPFKKEVFAIAERYLNTGTAGNYPAVIAGILIKKLQATLLRDGQFELMYKGLLAVIDTLNVCRIFTTTLAERKDNGCDSYKKELQLLQDLLSHPRLHWIMSLQGIKHLPLLTVAKCDYLLKRTVRKQMETLLESIYRLDVYISVSYVAKEKSFYSAKALPKASNIMRSTALWHPSLINGIANPLSFHHDQNMIFLTGANMAGKSTFMKAFGIAVYLAHMGFPVAAKDMVFSVRDGLYSSINVADDLNQGYSHFYAEVLRVKKVAEEVSGGKNMVVLFDELFKGTNVKDAYDGTFAVTEAFSKYRNCFYIVSTHIIEVGEALQENTRNLQFAYLPTIMDGSTPKYTYQLREGITSDRQGMLIIQNEGIIDMLVQQTVDFVGSNDINI